MNLHHINILDHENRLWRLHRSRDNMYLTEHENDYHIKRHRNLPFIQITLYIRITNSKNNQKREMKVVSEL